MLLSQKKKKNLYSIITLEFKNTTYIYCTKKKWPSKNWPYMPYKLNYDPQITSVY